MVPSPPRERAEGERTDQQRLARRSRVSRRSSARLPKGGAPMSEPRTMPAAVYQGDRTITVERRPVPEPGPGEVLLEVSHCGVCGSDLHMVMEGWGQPGSTGGHEYSGTIVALGDGVTGWQVGDRVVGGP